MNATVSPASGVAAAQLAVSGLGVRFGPLTALDSIDLTVRAGEVVALAGENGAGKSTLVRCIAGDLAPTTGAILLDGRPVPADPIAAKRRGISVVWQDLSLCENLNVASNVLLGRERRGQLLSDIRLRTDAARIFERLGVPLRDPERSVRSLSGGQRQMVAVARAMVHQPRLLLLDEPTASLGVQESGVVEELIMRAREQGTTVVLACHDTAQMFRLADRIVVLRHGRAIAEVSPSEVHPDDVVALVSGQEVDSSARRQLIRLHGLTGRLVSADPSSSLSLILSALGAALGSERLCIHLLEDASLVCAASLGLAPRLLHAWSRLPCGPAGGPVGLAAAGQAPVVEENVQGGTTWGPFTELARSAKVASSWSVPVLGPGGLLGVITVFRATAGRPRRDDLDLASLYAGYVASAVDRDRLLEQVTARNRVLETIREMLQILGGPVPVAEGLGAALQALRRGLEADEVALLAQPPDGPAACRAAAGREGDEGTECSAAVRHAAAAALAVAGHDGAAVHSAAALRSAAADAPPAGAAEHLLSVAFPAPGGRSALVARWCGTPPPDATALLEDAAHSVRLALEREAAWSAIQETAALRRSRELQRGFLSRLSHELRTPLTAIKGYASSLLQPDVSWDEESQHRFLTRIAVESSRLGRLVDDLLRFSAIESGVLQLQRDWCSIPLVLDAAIACLPPAGAGAPLVEVDLADRLPPIWADHDRLEQVFVNLLSNATSHNPAGTRVMISAAPDGPGTVLVTVADDGPGLPADVAQAPFEPMRRRRRAASSGSGLGLSIARGIVAAHGGRMELAQPARGTCIRIHLPVESQEDTAVADA
jgi:signal transduction histidine kinase/ABC-type multidrug transport system ATPase subunit